MQEPGYTICYLIILCVSAVFAFWGAFAYLIEGITPFFERLMHITFALLAIMILIKCVEEMNK